jgi:hypothetical protein
VTQPFTEIDTSVGPVDGMGNSPDPMGSPDGWTFGALPQAAPEDWQNAFGDGSGYNFSGTLNGADGVTGDRAAVIAYAQTMLGTPYQWGGNTPGKGLDCSGLVQQVWKKFGLNLPRLSSQQAHAGTSTPLGQLQAGDLVTNRDGSHIALYMGNGQIIEAPHTGSFVKIRKIGKGEQLYGVHLNYNTGMAARTDFGNGTASGKYADVFAAAGRQYNIDPRLLSAIARAESGYNPNARSAAGAVGLMQLMPGTARSLGVVNPLDPKQAAYGAARLLEQLLKQFNGNVTLAIAAYNAGPGAVKKYGGIPPYAETKAYVSRVLGYWRG